MIPMRRISAIVLMALLSFPLISHGISRIGCRLETSGMLPACRTASLCDDGEPVGVVGSDCASWQMPFLSYRQSYPS